LAPEQRLTARHASGSWDNLQLVLLAGVVSIRELDLYRGVCLVVLFEVDLNFRDGEVREGLQSILDRVGVLGTGLCYIYHDGTRVVFSAELIDKTELEERLFQIFAVNLCETTIDILFIDTKIVSTLRLGVVALGASAE